MACRAAERFNFVDFDWSSHDDHFASGGGISFPLHLGINMLHPDNVVGDVEILNMVPCIIVNSLTVIRNVNVLFPLSVSH